MRSTSLARMASSFDFVSPRASVALLVLLAACGGSVDGAPTTDAAADVTDTGSTPTDTATPGDSAPIPDVAAADVAKVDTGTVTTSTCAAAGGTYCSRNRWELCPAGFEPIATGDGHYDCGEIDGWCCVPAPASTCSASGKGNCVPGPSCTGCWTSVGDPSLFCETGRSCCVDMCD